MVGTPGEGKEARGVAEPRPRGGTKAQVRRWREGTRVGLWQRRRVIRH
jgi:hypothetical protein